MHPVAGGSRDARWKTFEFEQSIPPLINGRMLKLSAAAEREIR
jgi:hypothetical protein